ncbi:MAG: FkbM family methyltransferase [Pseudomonadota bacterium]
MAKSSLKKRFRRFRESVLGPLLLNRKFWARPIYTELGRRDAKIIVNGSDHRIVVDPGDRVIGQAILRKGVWGRVEQDAVIAFLAARGLACGVFVDVGANIGSQTLYAMLSGKFDRAVAIEPFTANGDLFEMTMRLNDLSDRVSIVRAAAGAQAGTATLYTDAWNSGGHSLKPIRSGPEVADISVVTVDQALADHNCRTHDVGLVWIDVEGAEVDVLEGMPDLLSARPALMVEYTPAFHDPLARQRFVAQVRTYYDRIYTVDAVAARGMDAEPLADDALDDLDTQTDLLCLADARSK